MSISVQRAMKTRATCTGWASARTAPTSRSVYRAGGYEDVPDAELEQLVLEKHPQYRDKLCVLPAWIDATPLQIVKYEVASSAAVAFDPEGWLRAAVAAAVFSFVALNAYYRLVVVKFGQAPSEPASTDS